MKAPFTQKVLFLLTLLLGLSSLSIQAQQRLVGQATMPTEPRIVL